MLIKKKRVYRNIFITPNESNRNHCSSPIIGSEILLVMVGRSAFFIRLYHSIPIYSILLHFLMHEFLNTTYALPKSWQVTQTHTVSCIWIWKTKKKKEIVFCSKQGRAGDADQEIYLNSPKRWYWLDTLRFFFKNMSLGYSLRIYTLFFKNQEISAEARCS